MPSSVDLAPEAFHALLTALDADGERAAARYGDLRFRLVRLFRWRGLRHAEELADETLDRVARKLDAGHPIKDPWAFALGVARLVRLEAHRAEAREQDGLAELGRQKWDEPGAAGKASECLTRCLDELPAAGRQLLLSYYADESAEKVERRKELAEALQMPLNALRIRICRLRTLLEKCMGECVGGRWR
jgi:DNA-directed RNA polymerase specialized sigma24 family protein